MSHFHQNTTRLLAVLTEGLQPARIDCLVSACGGALTGFRVGGRMPVVELCAKDSKGRSLLALRCEAV